MKNISFTLLPWQQKVNAGRPTVEPSTRRTGAGALALALVVLLGASLVPAASAVALGWSLEATVNRSTEDSMKAVSCASPELGADCYAIGYDKAHAESFFSYWTDTEWRQGESEHFAGEATAVSCTGTLTVACTAVGTSGGSLHYWRTAGYVGGTMPAPTGGTSLHLSGISCTALNACTAVGSYYSEGSKEWKSLVERKEGSEWKLQTAPNPAEGNASSAMLAVSCVSTTSCTTVGTAASKPTAEHWNGETWSRMTILQTGETTLEAVSCASTTACTAVGHDVEGRVDHPYVEELVKEGMFEWEAHVLRAPEESVGGSDLNGVYCVHARECFAVGKRVNKVNEKGAPTEERTLVYLSNKGEWKVQSSPNPPTNKWSALVGVSCTAWINAPPLGRRTRHP